MQRPSLNWAYVDRQGISADMLRQQLFALFSEVGEKKRVLLIPPDATRQASWGGTVSRMAGKWFGASLAAVLPATGKHRPMSAAEKSAFFGDLPGLAPFYDHNPDHCRTLGEVSADEVTAISGGLIAEQIPVQVNPLLDMDKFDLIISIGQVVPHEVAGMANHSKNILIGVGGSAMIDQSHYLGALFGLERIIGQLDNPVRRLFDCAAEKHLNRLPVLYILTVVADGDDQSSAENSLCGLFAGFDRRCLNAAAALSARLNIHRLPRKEKKIFVLMNNREYRSCWLTNKAIYRSRKAVADGGEIVILAPHLQSLAEDEQTERLITRIGYRDSETIKHLMRQDNELGQNPAVAAHLIHGSGEGRFQVTYSCPRRLAAKIEAVGYNYLPPEQTEKVYQKAITQNGYLKLDEHQTVYSIHKAPLALWQSK